MKVSDFYYDLPKELIAQHGLEKRDESRLMVLNKEKNSIEHKKFNQIIEYLKKGDTLVINNTKVIPARLYGKKDKTDTKIEILLLKNLSEKKWEILAKPGRKLKLGDKIIFEKEILEGTIIEKKEDGNKIIEFKYDGIFNEILDKIGLMPLPPYIKEKLEDKNRYQTVYAKNVGSAAAPTAGLHFTEELLNKIRKKGINIANVTLHVGIGTFRPVKEEVVENHIMHKEYFYIKKEDVEIINKTKKEGKKIIAVGTTSCRVLESITDEFGYIKEFEGETNIFIYPRIQI